MPSTWAAFSCKNQGRYILIFILWSTSYYLLWLYKKYYVIFEQSLTLHGWNGGFAIIYSVHIYCFYILLRVLIRLPFLDIDGLCVNVHRVDRA